MMKITIVIPCYNSADTIGKVVDLTSKLLIANLYDLPIIDIAFAETQIMDTGSLLTNILYNSKFQFTVHKNEIIRLLLSKIASLPRRSTPTSAPTSKKKSCTIKIQEIS